MIHGRLTLWKSLICKVTKLNAYRIFDSVKLIIDAAMMYIFIVYVLKIRKFNRDFIEWNSKAKAYRGKLAINNNEKMPENHVK